ncbi:MULTISPECIES: HIT domain-containing protein [Acidithrix]|uniref:AP-4-A phosphorylase n=2 Tax=root TaxID=1 RepID=A0A0D8HJM9_9ACTN|nr:MULTISPECIES: HIT domain-containing protein [Acidithrix]KJF18084.1 AP-4-A phosphorylase [Acidithrix ferrooxidans]CAG4930145.1 unnamed protein product [Acidithrix sp. C25]
MIDILWAGWRRTFVEGVSTKQEMLGCILCKLGEPNTVESNLVLHYGEGNYVVLNAYPYAPAHLMVIPYLHHNDILDLSQEEAIENTLLLRRAIGIVRDVYNPDGFNVGANISKAGGAAIDDHVHFHLVPRWIGDTNFATTIANIRVLPESLDSTYGRLKDAWEKRDQS